MIHALQQGDYKPSFVVEETAEEKARRKKPVEVWIHNDDYTPAEYVVNVLETVFKLGIWKATWVMARAHVTGKAMVGVYPRGKAEEKVAAAEDRARRDGWPLRFSIEETDG